MKIVFFAGRLPPLFGGMETHAYECMRYFSTDVVLQLVHIFTFAPEMFATHRRIAGETAAAFPAPVTYLLPSSRSDHEEICAVLSTLHLTHGDTLFFNDPYWISVIPNIQKAFPHVRIMLVSGGNDLLETHTVMDPQYSLEQAQKFVIDVVNNHIDWLVVCSNFCMTRYVELGIAQHKIHVVIGGVDTTSFHPAEPGEQKIRRKELGLPMNGLLLFTAARLEPFKGLTVLLDALSLLAHIPNLHLVIAGDGPCTKDLTMQAHQLHLQEKILFRGAVGLGKLPLYYQAADVFCLTSIELRRETRGGSYIHTETMGRTLCEAAASGLPVVATRVGGIPEVVEDGKTGILVPPKDPHATAEAMQKLLEDPLLRTTYGARARSKAQQAFSWEQVCKVYTDILLL